MPDVGEQVKTGVVEAATSVLKERTSTEDEVDQYNTAKYLEELQGKDFIANLFCNCNYMCRKDYCCPLPTKFGQDVL